MRFKLLFANVLFCLSVGDPGSAHQATASTQLQATTLLAQSASALGSSVATSDVTMSGSAHRIAGSDDEDGIFTYKALRSGGTRYDFSLSSGNRSEIRPPASAGLAGEWTGPEGNSGLIANHNLIADPGIFPAFTVGALNGLNPSQAFVVTFIGPETKNGLPVYHLSAYQQFPQMSAAAASFAQHLTQTEIFLDPATLLPVAIDFNSHPDNDATVDLAVELVFSNYQVIGGIQVPFHVQKYLNNGLVLDLQIQSVVLNSGISASTFQVQ